MPIYYNEVNTEANYDRALIKGGDSTNIYPNSGFITGVVPAGTQRVFNYGSAIYTISAARVGGFASLLDINHPGSAALIDSKMRSGTDIVYFIDPKYIINPRRRYQLETGTVELSTIGVLSGRKSFAFNLVSGGGGGGGSSAWDSGALPASPKYTGSGGGSGGTAIQGIIVNDSANWSDYTAKAGAGGAGGAYASSLKSYAPNDAVNGAKAGGSSYISWGWIPGQGEQYYFIANGGEKGHTSSSDIFQSTISYPGSTSIIIDAKCALLSVIYGGSGGRTGEWGRTAHFGSVAGSSNQGQALYTAGPRSNTEYTWTNGAFNTPTGATLMNAVTAIAQKGASLLNEYIANMKPKTLGSLYNLTTVTSLYNYNYLYCLPSSSYYTAFDSAMSYSTPEIPRGGTPYGHDYAYGGGGGASIFGGGGNGRRNPNPYSEIFNTGNPYNGAGGGGGGADSRTAVADRKNGGNGTPGFVVIFF